jgi:hypothetical protein
MIQKISVILFSLLLLSSVPPENRLRMKFANPLPENRPNLNTHGSPHHPEKQDSILDRYLANGYGGLATNVNWTDDYLKNEREWDSFYRFVRAAKSRGMNVWLYDENWYPSGMAGGYILEGHPEWEAEGLFFKDSLISGPQKFSLKFWPGKLLSIKAFPVAGSYNLTENPTDLSQFVSDGTLHWSAPAGNWRIASLSSGVLRAGFQAGNKRGGKDRFYPSLLMPEVTKQFIELTHKKYAEKAGEELGNLFYATFTDEPSSMGHSFQNLGYGIYPWKKKLSDELHSRFDWRPEDKWLTIMYDDGNEGKRLRYQYFSLIREFMSNYFFKTVKDYCNSEGVKSSGHLLLEESLPIQALLYGDIMACFREMDIPGIDVLTGMPGFTRRYLYSSRMAASSAELNGNTEVMSEICPVADQRFHNGKEAPTSDVKGTVNRQLVGGVTRFNNYLKLQHASQEEKMEFNTYVARISTMMNSGYRASKIALLYPVETIWTKLRPVPSWNKSWDNMAGGAPEVRKLSELFDSLADQLYTRQWEFSYIDVKALTDSKISKGKLCHGQLKWDVLILPGVETITPSAMKTIQSFVKAGGKVLAFNAMPENSPDYYPDVTIKSASEKLFQQGNALFLKEFSPDALQSILEKWIPSEFRFKPSNLPVLCSHKKVNGADVVLMVNDSNQPLSFNVSFSKKINIETWNPDNGLVEKAGNPVQINLKAYDGIILKY